MISVMYNGSKYLWSNILTEDLVRKIVIDTITSNIGLNIETFKKKIRDVSVTDRQEALTSYSRAYTSIDVETTVLQLYENAVKNNTMALLARDGVKTIVPASKIDEIVLDNPEELEQFRKLLIESAIKVVAQLIGLTV